MLLIRFLVEGRVDFFILAEIFYEVHINQVLTKMRQTVGQTYEQLKEKLCYGKEVQKRREICIAVVRYFGFC